MRQALSFTHAFRGIWTAVTTQPNLRFHVLIGSIILYAASYLRSSIAEILVLFLTIALVMTVEMVNTAIEFACNAITLKYNPYIKQAKDVSAGAVLMATIFAIIIGLMIFIPKLI